MLDKKKLMKWVWESEQGLSTVRARTASQENAVRGGLAILAVLRTCVEKGQFDFVMETEEPHIEKPPELPELHKPPEVIMAEKIEPAHDNVVVMQVESENHFGAIS